MRVVRVLPDVAAVGRPFDYEVPPFSAILLGGITGVGGGTIRDVLLNQVPTVLRFEVYASAALLGSICMIVATKVRVPSTWAATLGGALCFLLRVVSLVRHWNVPRALGP